MNYFQLLRKIFYGGKHYCPRSQATRELINAKLIVDGANFFTTKEARPLEKVKNYLMGELAWYYSGSTKVEDIGRYSKFWIKLADINGQVNSNYGHLVYYKKPFQYTSYNWCLNILKKDPHSRQAIILYNDRDCYYTGNKDFICTQLQHFLIRDGHLMSIIYLRSSDAILGLQYDIPWWHLVQQQLALELDMPCGRIEVNIGSSHIYSRNYELVGRMIEDEQQHHLVSIERPIPIGESMEWYEKNLEHLIKIRRVK